MTGSPSLAKHYCSIEPRTRKYVKRYRFLSFARNLFNKYGKHSLDAAFKTGLNGLKTASIKVVQKAAEATGELIGNKIAEKILKPAENSRNFEEIVILPEKREKILNELKQVLQK